MNREEVIKKIIERCCVLFNKQPDELSENTNFAVDLGAKSGNVSQMTNFLEDEFDAEKFHTWNLEEKQLLVKQLISSLN